ncbi:DUF4365 domain-containing protein [Dethiothermospora halolimnae]|uniref:DUF4365 domain-containing protein n=1 Tax=Dethiothermospora halolimnae TaxID=3114390 RepID=UPI003CCC172D
MRSKRKSKSHIIEEESLQIINNILPKYWTKRKYMPDYGIDLEIEIFEKTEIDGKEYYDTFGEHIFVQVKGTESIDIGKYKVYKRSNVEKYKIGKKEVYKEIDVVKYPIETTELYTVERMSNSVPVLLFIVDIINNNIYYICLNDYIDKVLIPGDPNFYDKNKKTIYIPLENKIKINEQDFFALKFYAKRPKLYSFFNKVNYQNEEVNYLSEDELIQIYPHFLEILMRYDIWSIRGIWPMLNLYYKYLNNLKNTGNPKMFTSVSSKKKEDQDITWKPTIHMANYILEKRH